MNAGKDSSSDAREAFGRLYRAYSSPLLAYLRRDGCPEAEAQDLLQGFFGFLLEKKSLGKVRREGKFRSWLLTCLKHFLADVRDHTRADKRGGAATHVPLAGETEETGVDVPHPGRTPDQEYECQFALQFLESVMVRLEQEYRTRGKTQLYEVLCPFLLDKKGALSHAELGRQLELSEDHVSQEISRLRKRYREIFDVELEKLVGGREELEAEKQHLFAALRT